MSGFIAGISGNRRQVRRPGAATRRCPAVVARASSDQQIDVSKMLEELEKLKRENESLKEGRSEESTSVKRTAPEQLGNPKILEVGTKGVDLVFEELAAGVQSRCAVYVGNLSRIKAADIRSAPQFTPHENQGWLYTGKVENPGKKCQAIAMPALKLFENSMEIVITSCAASEIGFSFPNKQDGEVYLVLDKSAEALKFEERKFYVWETDGKLLPGWLAEEPSKEAAVAVARILLVYYSEGKKPRVPMPFAEFSEDFEF
mmetsp:Transcript_719/g.2371  ORF Transcript_719/g.2371 Transcript_719/m.2371 type:complete len:259 (+) Transcript_719:98-874(+)|eukprot:CAMPEP_0198726190 /NCGR_PEP_ID=MMETSP1475-20131203/3329_1 /TAXON_ID= ORGANISM="Unidentified sp., Strain CCMP1999" /NCGR_SAMPLE_ID=MMETSP1475 /ASSEMBLY_ACC=CAM_ASM_001111 /LENGTH=258 /DNA_ID=CAMNT_0044488093 /DNA_START=92 /DNA_END=868 /DNA_ORIENTATION=+